MAGQGLDARKRRHPAGLVFCWAIMLYVMWAIISWLPIYNPNMRPPSSPPPLIDDVAGNFCLYKQSPKLKKHCMRREREERTHFKTSKNAALLLLHEPCLSYKHFEQRAAFATEIHISLCTPPFFIFNILFFIQLLVTLPFFKTHCL